MNFTPFATTFSGSLPSGGVTQFTTAKFAHQVGGGAGQVVGLLSADEAGVTYLRPVDANGFTLNLATQQGVVNSTDGSPQIITLPISVPGAKPGDLPQQLQIQVVNPGPGTTGVAGEKYVPISLQPFQQGATVLTVAYPSQDQGDAIQLQLQTADPGQVQQATNNNTTSSNNNNTTQTTTTTSVPQPGMHAEEIVLPDVKTLNEDGQDGTGQAYPVAVVTHIPPDLILRTEDPITDDKDDTKDKQTDKKEVMECVVGGTGESYSGVAGSWQQMSVPATNVADYLSRLPSSTMPLSLQHFLKFSAETIKRESAIESSPLAEGEHQATEEVDETCASQHQMTEVNTQDGDDGKGGKKKKKYKKKPPKPRRPRPGQVHIAVALDGTTLFCCPECNMAYPDKEMLEQHLIAHKIERRFICDICGAGLKRKEHLERHKLGHNPERPYICSVCCKGFKRKEHLNLHFVIHSGEKSEVCPECGKGFHRKDHLRKHARSHLAKRVKEEAVIVQATVAAQAEIEEAMAEVAKQQQTVVTTQAQTDDTPQLILHHAAPQQPTQQGQPQPQQSQNQQQQH